jgi:hypothetical protein
VCGTKFGSSVSRTEKGGTLSMDKSGAEKIINFRLRLGREKHKNRQDRRGRSTSVTADFRSYLSYCLRTKKALTVNSNTNEMFLKICCIAV